MTRRTAMRAPSPLGVAIVLVTLVGLEITPAIVPPVTVLIGLGLLAGAGWWASTRGPVIAVVCTAPGAALIGFGDYEGASWLGPAAAITSLVVVPLAMSADREWARWGAAPLWYLLSCIGMYACVPDTEEARVLVVVALVAAAASRVPRLRALGPIGAGPAVGLFLWIAAYDARGRPASFIGAAGALGLLALEPVGRWLRRSRAPLARGSVAFLVLLAAQTVLAAYSGRGAGLQEEPRAALVRVAPVVAIAALGGMVCAASSRPRARRTRPLGS